MERSPNDCYCGCIKVFQNTKHKPSGIVAAIRAHYMATTISKPIPTGQISTDLLAQSATNEYSTKADVNSFLLSYPSLGTPITVQN